MKALAVGVMAVIVALVIGTWLGTAYTSSRINAKAAQNCASVNTLDTSLLTILNRSFKSLPAIAYYKQHPQELSKALEQTAQSVNDLQAARCTQ